MIDGTPMFLERDEPMRLGGRVMPGIIQDIQVSNEIKVKEMTVDGGSGSAKLPQGYKDADITVTIRLVSSDDLGDAKYQLAAWAGLFKTTDDQAMPFTYQVCNSHLAAYNIRTVLFQRIATRETSASDTITVDLGLAEHRPAVIQKEKLRRAKAAAAEKLKAKDKLLRELYGLLPQNAWYAKAAILEQRKGLVGLVWGGTEANVAGQEALQKPNSSMTAQDVYPWEKPKPAAYHSELGFVSKADQERAIAAALGEGPSGTYSNGMGAQLEAEQAARVKQFWAEQNTEAGGGAFLDDIHAAAYQGLQDFH